MSKVITINFKDGTGEYPITDLERITNINNIITDCDDTTLPIPLETVTKSEFDNVIRFLKLECDVEMYMYDQILKVAKTVDFLNMTSEYQELKSVFNKKYNSNSQLTYYHQDPRFSKQYEFINQFLGVRQQIYRETFEAVNKKINITFFNFNNMAIVEYNNITEQDYQL